MEEEDDLMGAEAGAEAGAGAGAGAGGPSPSLRSDLIAVGLWNDLTVRLIGIPDLDEKVCCGPPLLPMAQDPAPF